MDQLRAGSQADRELNRIRDQVFEQCGEAGEQKPGIFTLTAPTGVGKTLSLLHFALRHCIANQGLRRIIVVLPFLSLTEQSQREYEKLIPHILTDHSQSKLSEEDRELVARWDVPFIITTSVRFFEGLFSCQPKDCRKLHQIAQSVILFDEAQSLPTDLMTTRYRPPMPCAKTMAARWCFPPLHSRISARCRECSAGSQEKFSPKENGTIGR